MQVKCKEAGTQDDINEDPVKLSTSTMLNSLHHVHTCCSLQSVNFGECLFLPDPTLIVCPNTNKQNHLKRLLQVLPYSSHIGTVNGTLSNLCEPSEVIQTFNHVDFS